MSEKLAGTPHPGLHLVIDEKQAKLVGDVAKPAQIALWRISHATLALDRLDHDRRRLFADRGPPLRQNAEGAVVKTAHRPGPALLGGPRSPPAPYIARAGPARTAPPHR